MATPVNINHVNVDSDDGSGTPVPQLPRSMYSPSEAPAIGTYETDAEMAARLQRELNPKPRMLNAPISQEVHVIQNEIDRNEREQQRLALEISNLEAGSGQGYYLDETPPGKKGRKGKKSKKNKKSKSKKEKKKPERQDSGLDFMRPKNFKPYFCIFMMVFCITMMVVEIWQNDWTFEPFKQNPLFGPSSVVLMQLGAKRTKEIVEDGDTYRLFAPMVLHGGILHLVFNMFGLLQVGFPIEREFGPVKVGSIFIVSGFAGVLASSVFIPELLGVGASGAIFGLFGSAWADLIQNWTLYRGQAWKNLIQLTIVTVFNVALGLMPYLDNFAHMGGFITGFILGLSLLVQTRYSYEGKKKQRREYQLCLQALSIIVLPMMLTVLTLVLYLQIDAYEWCTWCHYVSCVPFPPGRPDAEKWWDCNPSSWSGKIAHRGPCPKTGCDRGCQASAAGEGTHRSAASGSGERGAHIQ